MPPGSERPAKRARLEGASAVGLEARLGRLTDVRNSRPGSRPNDESGESNGSAHDGDNHDDGHDDGMNDHLQTTGRAEQLGNSSSTMSLVDGVGCPK